MGVEAEMDAVEAKNDKERNRKRYQVLARLLQLPDQQRFRPMKPPGR